VPIREKKGKGKEKFEGEGRKKPPVAVHGRKEVICASRKKDADTTYSADKGGGGGCPI